MVNVVKELGDITTPEPAILIFVHVALRPLDGAKQSLALAATPGIVTK